MPLFRRAGLTQDGSVDMRNLDFYAMHDNSKQMSATIQRHGIIYDGLNHDNYAAFCGAAQWPPARTRNWLNNVVAPHRAANSSNERLTVCFPGTASLI